jgi:hypothetical protein
MLLLASHWLVRRQPRVTPLYVLSRCFSHVTIEKRRATVHLQTVIV